MGLLNRGLDAVPTTAGDMPVMMVRLRSGEVVALVGTTDPGSTAFTLVSRDPDDAGQIIDHFCKLTGFPAGEVFPIRQAPPVATDSDVDSA